MYEVIAAIVILIISVTISLLMMPKPVDAVPATFDEFDFPQFEEGTPQSVVFGDVWISDWMVLWYGDFKVKPIKKKGGK